MSTRDKHLPACPLFTPPTFSGALGDVEVRPMVPEDEPAFRTLYAEVRARELAYVDWPLAQKQAFCDSQYALQDQHYRRYYPDFEPWAICRAGAVIGRIYFGTSDGALALMDITIAASARGQGIGSRLLEEVLRRADAERREVRLHVELTNPARHWYQRLGFIDFGDAGVYQEMRRAPAPVKTPVA